MSATSVTGIGIGSSFGKYKPENNCGGCSCGCGKNCPPDPVAPRKIGCYTRNKVGSMARYMAANSSTGIKVCS
jgi:hypothetical protein